MTHPLRPRWTNKYKQNWEDSQDRILAWWAGDGLKRPLVMSSVPRPDAPPFETPHTGPPPPVCLDEVRQLVDERHWFESRLFLAESAPCAWNGHATGLLPAVMAGAMVRRSSAPLTIWIDPVEGLYERPLPEFDETCPVYGFALQMMRRHLEVFAADCLLGSNSLLDPLTTLSLMRGVTELCVDLVERPEVVLRWCERLTDLYVRIVSEFRAVRSESGRYEDLSWTGMWAPWDFQTAQCDFSVMLSSEMFDRFVRPELERQVGLFQGTIWHLDGSHQVHHLEAICSFEKIRAIQWVENERKRAMERVDLFRRIRQLGKSLIIECADPDEAVALTKELGKDGLAFLVGEWINPPGAIKDETEMESLLKRLKAV
jgi:hypothetical protein